VGSGLNDKPYPLDITGQPRVDVSAAAAAAESAKKEEPAKDKSKATPAPKGKK